MFVDEIKIYARAGHGGKGCIAFQREKYRPKGGPSGGNGGRGGDVILEADHDLNNLIAQYYQPRLIAQDGRGGLGKGMDGHAGRDLIIKVPCGTLVWKLAPDEAGGTAGEDSAANLRAALLASSSQRPVFRTSGSGRAMEIDLAAGARDGLAATGPKPSGELVADLTNHGSAFYCAGVDAAAWGTATLPPPRAKPRVSRSRANREMKANFGSSCGSWPRSAWSAIPTPASPLC